MNQALLERETRRHFPELANGVLSSEPIVRGGSGRSYFRLRFPPLEQRLILMHYTLDRPDHEHFLPASRYLETLGARVPAILAADEERHLVWMEDLGRTDLWSLRDQPWETLGGYYRDALAQAARLHAVPEGSFSPPLQPPFDVGLYRWEQEYFARHFLERCCALTRTEADSLLEDPAMRELAEELAALPRFLIHRDFQSQNILLKDGRACLIDYQGIRWGRPEYDVASLLLDPYTDLTGAMREELLDFYRSSFQPDTPPERFRRVFAACGLQRLMQALGAYGNLALNSGLTLYLGFIPVAVERLRFLVQQSDRLGILLPLLRSERLVLP